MCFYNEYDWTASIVLDSPDTATKDTHCDECGRPILAGETYRHLFMQEHDECQQCNDDDLEDCTCDEPQYGESYNYESCIECSQFLQAIKEVEKEEGCTGDEVSPALGQMIEQVAEIGEEESRKYFVRAREKFPALHSSGYLDRLQQNMF